VSDVLASWLADEPSGFKVFIYIGLYVPICMILSLLMLGFAETLHAPIIHQTVVIEELKSVGPMLIFPSLLGAAVAEELIFRLAPLAVVLYFFGRRPGLLLLTSLVVSAVFGIVHGNYVNIFIQGMSGFLLSLLFLKCGGFNGNVFKGCATSSLGHFLFNSLIVVPLIVTAATV
jgi:membrane protease YdiL (CAAX protease family)